MKGDVSLVIGAGTERTTTAFCKESRKNEQKTIKVHDGSMKYSSAVLRPISLIASQQSAQ